MKKINEYLIDDISKQIYENREKYNNGDVDAFDQILECVHGGRELLEFMRMHEALYIFGAGILGVEFYNTFKGGRYKIVGFIDNYKSKQTISGLNVFALADVIPTQSVGIVVVNKYHSREIIDQLLADGFETNHFFEFSRYQLELNYRQYFDLDSINSGSYCFVDCGALDGYSSLCAKKWCGDISEIWAFEPDKNNLIKCQKNLEKIDVKFDVIPKAVWKCETVLQFDEISNGMSSINSNGSTFVEATTLDTVIPRKKDLYIKMDIEGAEQEAIQGAKELILECKPKMAVCIYHKKKDLYEIPNLLLSFNSHYRFYVRHYSLTNMETVIYAV